MCKNECISEGICRHNEECCDDLCFTSEQLKIVDKWLADKRAKTIKEFVNLLKKKLLYTSDENGWEGYTVEEKNIDEVAEQMKGETE